MKAGLLLACLLAGSAAAQERQSLVSTQVRIGGEVQQALTLTVDNLRTLAHRRGRVEAAGYAGIRLTDLLEEADIRRDARQALRRTYVVAGSSDGFQAVFSWGELFNSPAGRSVLVVFERDSQPLRDGEGRIALVALADERPSTRHVKWLTRIEVKRVPD